VPPLNSITLDVTAAKLVYTVGDTFDITGIVVTGAYSHGVDAPVAITADNVSGYDKDTVGTQTITVTVSGKTATFEIQVKAAEKAPEDPEGCAGCGTIVAGVSPWAGLAALAFIIAAVLIIKKKRPSRV
jgi:hypothetical protein